MSDEHSSTAGRLASARERVDEVRGRAQRMLVWQVWERMLETEFVDRSVALAGKAFVSFFPLVIVVAAFMPPSIRSSILATLTHRLGVQGHALGPGQAGVQVGQRHPQGQRRPRPRAHLLLRQLVHHRPAAPLPAGVAPAVAPQGGGLHPGPRVARRHARVHGRARRPARADGQRDHRARAVLPAARSRSPGAGGRSPRGSCCSARCAGGCCSPPGSSPASRCRPTRSRPRSGCPRS